MSKLDYEERREKRIERLNNKADRAQKESDRLFDSAHDMASVIPFGQPILVGHHSEGRDRRYRARIQNKFERAVETGNKATHYAERAAAAESNTAISSDDPNAIDKLRDKLASLEAAQERMKKINAAHKKYLKNSHSLEATDLSESDKQLIISYVPSYSWEPHPFPPYAMQNNNANIKRVRDRISQLERIERKPSTETKAEGYRIVENAEANRLQIFFDEKPSADARKILKRYGYRFAPSEGNAWQRHLSTTPRHHAEFVCKQIFGIA